MKYLVLLACLLLMKIDSSMAQRHGSIFERYPQNQDFLLSNGEMIQLPMHNYKAQGLILAGHADWKKLNTLLQKDNVVPTKLSGEKGLVLIFSLDYEDSSIGKYREIIYLVSAQIQGKIPTVSQSYFGLLSAFIPGLKTRNIGFYCWKIWVTSEKSVLVGREVWGYPKELAQIFQGHSSKLGGFNIKDQTGTEFLRASFNRDHFLGVELPLTLDLELVTPKSIHQTFSRAISKGTVKAGPFIRKKDELHINEQHPDGAALKNIGFTPLSWQQLPDVQTIFLAPTVRD